MGRIIFVLLVITMAFSSCEDDPILEPASGDKKTGGSYGRLGMYNDSISVNPNNSSNQNP